MGMRCRHQSVAVGWCVMTTSAVRADHRLIGYRCMEEALSLIDQTTGQPEEFDRFRLWCEGGGARQALLGWDI